MKGASKIIVLAIFVGFFAASASGQISFFTTPSGFHIDEPLVPQPETSTDWGFFANGTSGTLDIVGEEFRFIPANNDEYSEPVLILRRDGSASLLGTFDASVLSAPRLSLGSISNIFKDRFEMESGFEFKPENGEELTYDATAGWGIMRMSSTGEPYLDPLITRSTDNAGSDSALKPENGDELKYNENDGWGIMRQLPTGEPYLDVLVTKSNENNAAGQIIAPMAPVGDWAQSGSDIYYNLGDVMIGTNTQLGTETLTVNGGIYGSWFGDYEDGNYAVNPGETGTSLSLAGSAAVGTTTPISRLHVYQNDGATQAGAGITVEQDGVGDSLVQFFLTGLQRWLVGVDNSDSDKFKIGTGIDLDTGAAFTIDTAGQVGIGTTTPQSLLQVGTAINVTRQYLQIDVESGAPPAVDCDSDAEAGRMFVETSGGTGAYVLYICTGAADGWDTLTLSD